MSDINFIHRTFELAKLGLGKTWPNPLVGAVIVKDGKIIGEGYHHQYGHDHAEVDAIKNATESISGSTIYVNLEPCCHTNKQTPPCAQRLIKEGFKKVVICNLDPNPEVNGKGVELLRSHGIEVTHGVLALEGEELNEVFFHAQRTKLPFVHLKIASTLDGKIALPSGESQWITGEIARSHVHFERSQHQAVVVGAETLRTDNPTLNVRLPNYTGKQPSRIVFTKSGNLPKEAKLFTDENKAQTLIFTESILKIDFPSDQVFQIENLPDALIILFAKKIVNLYLEGGSNLAASFLQAGLVNKVSYYLNPSFLGEGKDSVSSLGLSKLSERPKLKNPTSVWLGEDLLISGRI